MIIKFDLDGTICEETTWASWNEAACYQDRTPKTDVIVLMKDLVAAGHVVIIETARRAIWRSLTEHWLASHGVPYHYLFMNKVTCDRVVDDLARTPIQLRKEIFGGGSKEDGD